MLNQISQLKLLLSVTILALVCFQQITTVTGHKCFVCLPPRMVNSDMMEIQKMFGSQNLDLIPKCADFNRSRREEFIRDCPKGNNGCLTKFSDGTLMRTCTNVTRDACDESVKSSETNCYCKKELCNTPERKLSDPPNVAASQARREGVARALHSGSSSLNSATSDDEDLTKFGGKKHESTEGSGDGDSNNDDNYYDTTYFGGEYDDDDEDDEDGDANSEDSDTAASPGDVDMTEPPPFIVEEEIAKWDSKFDNGGRKTDEKKDFKKVDHVDNDIDFEESDETKGRKAVSGGGNNVGNVHNPSDRKTVHVINAGTVPGSSTAVSLLIPHIAFILVVKFCLS